MAKYKDLSDRYLRKQRKKASDALTVVGEAAKGLAIYYVPVRDSVLRDSIRDKVKSLSLEIGAFTDYAYFVEEGTEKMSAQPYLKPIITTHADDISKAFNRIMAK